MEKDRVQGYVAGLEQIVKNNHLSLRETTAQLQEICQLVHPDKSVPPQVILDIRKTYKEIQDQLTRIKGIQQLLQGKYRPHYRRDPLRDREIAEFEFVAKNCYLKVEFMLKEMEAKKKLREREHVVQSLSPRTPMLWFRSKENQRLLLGHLQGLDGLNYEIPTQWLARERRKVTQASLRSLSLFAVSGEVGLIDQIHSHMRLRKYDIAERYDPGELRGALTHLREISASEAVHAIRRFIENSEFSKPKCLLLSVRSQKDLEKGALGIPEKYLQTMTPGEVKTFLV